MRPAVAQGALKVGTNVLSLCNLHEGQHIFEACLCLERLHCSLWSAGLGICEGTALPASAGTGLLRGDCPACITWHWSL